MHPVVDRLAAYGWRLLVLAAVTVGLVWLLRRLWVVLLALVVAVFCTRALAGPATWLRRRGLPPSLAASAALVSFLGMFALAGWFVVPRVAEEFGSLGPTLSDAVDDVQRWLVDDAPFDVDEADLHQLRSEAGDAVRNALRSSGGTLISGVVTAVEVATGLFLALVTTFFFLKDGPRLRSWVGSRVPARRRVLARRLAERAWSTLGGYLRGAAILGLVEAAIMAVTLALVGAGLVVPVALLTFAAAFVPFAGAIVAAAVAVLVTLATAGLGGAVVVGVVAVVVQQLDNDVLSPFVYGRALQLHPLVVLFALVAGGGLFGLAGTLLAVPVTAVVLNLMAEAAVVRSEEP